MSITTAVAALALAVGCGTQPGTASLVVTPAASNITRAAWWTMPP